MNRREYRRRKLQKMKRQEEGKGNQTKFQRFAVGGVAVAFTAGVLLVGTYAWRSISQEATNETIRTVDVGGRLHDDFDGSNKDVYAENFMTENEGGVPLYVRIRLDEYMETGSEAGKNRSSSSRKATPTISGTDINDVTTWVTHIPGETAADKCTGSGADLHKFWKWTMGGSKVYLPTFNKNKDSLQADINGTYEGTVVDDTVYYDDYKSYTLGQVVSGTAVYDDDDNDIEDANVYTKPEDHTAVETKNAVVMTMKEWKANGCKAGKYWVYDTDGWAYWAQALAPGEATGLLLDKIELTGQLSEDCYYAINVVAQFATADDWGSPEDPVGFYKDYDPENGNAGPTEDALFLLNQAAGKDYQLTVTTSERGLKRVEAGDSLAFTSEVSCMGHVTYDQDVVWSLQGAEAEDTTIDDNGVLSVSKEETAGMLQVTAKYSEHVIQTILVDVVQQ